ncbi:MAG: hypothetical protein PHP42_00110 [Bacteroidota bacterium]|nr:hypothetical protein [Bacteroidota bacterium]
MKKLFSFFFVIVVFSIPLFAQEEGTEPEKEYSHPLRTKIGGAGGVTPIVTMFDNAGLDKFLGNAGLPKLGTDPVYLIGGEGYGYIMFIKNVRMGGFGVSGSRTVSLLQNSGGGTLKKEVEYGISYGGFLVDYVVPVTYKVDVALGASIGGGSINVRMTRDDGSFKDWTDLWNKYGDVSSASGNYTRHLTGSFGVFNPHVSVEYTLLTWLQLRVGAGYPIFFSPDWKLDDKFTLDGVPSKIKANGYTINAGIMFGFFGW